MIKVYIEEFVRRYWLWFVVFLLAAFILGLAA